MHHVLSRELQGQVHGRLQQERPSARLSLRRCRCVQYRHLFQASILGLGSLRCWEHRIDHKNIDLIWYVFLTSERKHLWI